MAASPARRGQAVPMPVDWTVTPEGETLTLSPHRSLPPEGFVWFIGATSALLGLTMLAVVGSKVLWGLLPFAVAAVAAIWVALRASLRRGELREVLVIGPDTVTLTRRNPGQRDRHWRAPRPWARVEMAAATAPVPHYLTLHGGPRVVELGAFLTAAERQRVYADLRARLHRAG